MDKKQQLKEILKYIPAGSQTLSKNPSQFVIGVSPLTVAKASGCYFWDSQGKKYLDFLMALGPMTFGYADKTIDQAVKKQIDRGVIYSLPWTGELELAKLLKQTVPCAQMSRFLLNGNDVTSGAIRLARHITKRDHLAKCGYHGWQDWSVANKAGRNSGVPDIVKTLTHDFVYNDLESLKKIFKQYPNKIAAVILEPMADEWPAKNFLAEVKKLAHQHGAILIFDEMVTGFRWSIGGAQKYFKVMPDLACFGKAISNGYPIAVLAGLKKYMSRLDEVFVSTTFGGFTLGVAAGIATIKKIKATPGLYRHLHKVGNLLINGGNKLSKKYNLPIKFGGSGPHPIIKINAGDDYLNRLVKTYLYQKTHQAGIFFSTSILISYAHKPEHVNQLLKVLDKTFKELNKLKDLKQIKTLLKGEVVAPRGVRS